MRFVFVILLLGAGCATTGESGGGGAGEPVTLTSSSTAAEVFEKCEQKNASRLDVTYDCGDIEIVLHVGEDGPSFLEQRVAIVIEEVGAGPIRTAPFLLPVAGHGTTVMRTAVYTDSSEETEAMVHLGVFVASARLTLSCTAKASLPATSDVCARLIDQLALAPPGVLELTAPEADDAVTVKVLGVDVTLPPQCVVDAGPGTTQIRCADAQVTIRTFATSNEADEAAREPAEVLRAYGAEVDLRPISCTILKGAGTCHAGAVSSPGDEGTGLVLGTAQLEGGSWLSFECAASTGLSHPLCRALAKAR